MAASRAACGDCPVVDRAAVGAAGAEAAAGSTDGPAAIPATSTAAVSRLVRVFMANSEEKKGRWVTSSSSGAAPPCGSPSPVVLPRHFLTGAGEGPARSAPPGGGSPAATSPVS